MRRLRLLLATGLWIGVRVAAAQTAGDSTGSIAGTVVAKETGAALPYSVVSLARIDFSASTRIKSPDVSGSMYLDRQTFQIRRSTLRLTQIPDATPQIAAVEVITDFREILPSISVPSTIKSVQVLHTDRTRPVLPDTAYETQRMVGLSFLKTRPGEEPKIPRTPLS